MISSDVNLCPEQIEKWDRYVEGFRYPSTKPVSILTSKTKGNTIIDIVDETTYGDNILNAKPFLTERAYLTVQAIRSFLFID